MGEMNEHDTWPPAPQTVIPTPEGRAMREPLPFRRGLKALAALTLGLGVFPYLIYIPARLFGTLPDEKTWYASGGGGFGPWYHGRLGHTIDYTWLALVLLAPLTLLACVVMAVGLRRATIAALGLGLAVIQLGLAALISSTIMWVAE